MQCENATFSNMQTFELLEMYEDLCLSLLAERLDQEGAQIFSHEEAWK